MIAIISDKQRLIIDSFFQVAQEVQDCQKITMQMIADKVGMKRQNIYAKHFSSIEDMIETIHLLIDYDCKMKLQEFLRSDRQDLADYLAVNILPLLYQKRDWLRILYSTNLDSHWFEFLQKQYTPMIKSYFDKFGKNPEVPHDFLSKLVVGGMLTIISSWLTEKNPAPPSIFREKFIRILSTSTYDLLS